jgi:hypothetical protein
VQEGREWAAAAAYSARPAPHSSCRLLAANLVAQGMGGPRQLLHWSGCLQLLEFQAPSRLAHRHAGRGPSVLGELGSGVGEAQRWALLFDHCKGSMEQPFSSPQTLQC